MGAEGGGVGTEQVLRHRGEKVRVGCVGKVRGAVTDWAEVTGWEEGISRPALIAAAAERKFRRPIPFRVAGPSSSLLHLRPGAMGQVAVWVSVQVAVAATLAAPPPHPAVVRTVWVRNRHWGNSQYGLVAAAAAVACLSEAAAAERKVGQEVVGMELPVAAAAVAAAVAAAAAAVAAC